MNKNILIIFLTLLVFGIMVNAPILMAQNDSNPENIEDRSDSDDDSDNDAEEIDGDRRDQSERIMKKFERERDRERSKEKIERDFEDSDGKRVRIEREVELDENGKIKIRIMRKITNADGTVITKIMIIERDEDGVKKIIRIEGIDGLEVETELEIEDEFEGNETDVSAVLSNGKKAKIKVLPDRASEIALERLGALNFTKIELKEIRHKNVPRVVYNIETNKEGKFFGIFKLKLKVEGQVDPETGEFLGINRPWWAFLVIGEEVIEEIEDLGNNETGDEVMEEELENAKETEEENETDEEETVNVIENQSSGNEEVVKEELVNDNKEENRPKGKVLPTITLAP